MKKFISKPFLISLSLTGIILICLFFSMSAKAFLTAHKGRIEQELSYKLNHKTSIGSIYYIPPSFLILNDVALISGHDKKVSSLFSVRKIALVFSLKELISKKIIVINRINFVKPEIDAHKHPLFLKEKLKRIVEIINMLTQGGPLKVTLDNATLIFERKGDGGKMLMISANLDFGSDKKIKSRGKVTAYKFKEKKESKKINNELFTPFALYAFEGGLKAEGLDIQNIKLEFGDFQAALKGKLDKNVLSLKGLSTIEKFYQPSTPSFLKLENKFFKKIKNLMHYGRLPQKIGVSLGGLNILDIDCVIQFDPHKIIARNIDFSCNNIPVHLAADIAFQDKINTRFEMATFPEQKPELRQDNPKRLDVLFECEAEEEKLYGKFYVDFLRKQGKNQLSQTIKTDFSGLSFGILPDERIKMAAEELKIQYGYSGSIFDFFLNDFSLMFNMRNKSIKSVNFQSGFFDGNLKGYAWCDLTSKPFQIGSNFSIEDVSAHELDALLFSLFGAYRNLPAKLQGRVDGQFACDLDYTSYPSPHLTGRTIIQNGYLDNVTFFVWLADSFGLPSLKKVDFRELSLGFESTDDLSVLRDIRLEGAEILLEGEFQLKNNEFVSSKISVMLPSELLKKSPKFNLLLALIDKQTRNISFDFQLSGLYNSLNFQWLESEFKLKIQKMLPGFIKRGIERKIEKAIKSISDKK